MQQVSEIDTALTNVRRALYNRVMCMSSHACTKINVALDYHFFLSASHELISMKPRKNNKTNSTPDIDWCVELNVICWSYNNMIPIGPFHFLSNLFFLLNLFFDARYCCLLLSVVIGLICFFSSLYNIMYTPFLFAFSQYYFYVKHEIRKSRYTEEVVSSLFLEGLLLLLCGAADLRWIIEPRLREEAPFSPHPTGP